MSIFTKKDEPVKQESPVQAEPEIVKDETIAQAAETSAPETDETKIINTFVDEMGIVAEGTTIHGDISTRGHLAVAGIVKGRVVCAGNLMLTGEIKGDIDCNNLVLDDCTCTSTINARGSISIKENAYFAGNISCKHVSVMGSIVGHIRASGNVGLTKTAVVKGDIRAAVLAVEPGAKLTGNVDIR